MRLEPIRLIGQPNQTWRRRQQRRRQVISLAARANSLFARRGGFVELLRAMRRAASSSVAFRLAATPALSLPQERPGRGTPTWRQCGAAARCLRGAEVEHTKALFVARAQYFIGSAALADWRVCVAYAAAAVLARHRKRLGARELNRALTISRRGARSRRQDRGAAAASGRQRRRCGAQSCATARRCACAACASRAAKRRAALRARALHSGAAQSRQRQCVFVHCTVALACATIVI